MTEQEIEIMRSKTFLKAALPLLEEVVLASPDMQKMIAKWNCAVQFQIKNEEPAAHLLFEGGTLKDDERLLHGQERAIRHKGHDAHPAPDESRQDTHEAQNAHAGVRLQRRSGKRTQG